MKRRQFLTKALSVFGGIALSPLVIAEMNHGNHGMSKMNHNISAHSGHDMSNMGGHEEHDMAMMLKEGYQLGNRTLTSKDIEILQQADKNLLDPAFFPKGKDLPDLPRLKNESSEQNFFKATLTAKESSVELISNKKTDFWTYNDKIPGPLIEVYEGDTVEITLKNELLEPTTIHWHGLLVPASEDGNPQDEVLPGNSRTYRFTIPEGTAGTYWYHPHGHNTVAEQAFRGLAGAFIVRKKGDLFQDYPEKHLLISDLKLNSDGTIADSSFNDWMNGREGQFVLINGALKPNITIDETARLRIWNACSGKYLNLALDHADLFLIATDGGFIEKPQLVKTLLLSPGERAELIVVPKENVQVNLTALAYDRSKMGMVPPEKNLMLANITMQKVELPKLPQSITILPNWGVANKKQTIEYTEIMDMNQMVFLLNGKLHDMDRNDIEVNVGEVEEWVVFNNSHMDHNFHIHGTQFLIIGYENKEGKMRKPEINGLKDTVNLKPYEKVYLKMIQEQEGLRMFHCHILEHETLGMMGQLVAK